MTCEQCTHLMWFARCRRFVCLVLPGVLFIKGRHFDRCGGFDER